MPLSSLFRIYESNTLIHRLDPRSKLFFILLASYLAVSLTKPIFLLTLFAITFICHLLARIPFQRAKYLYFSYPSIFLVIAITQGFFFWGPQLTPLFTLISKEGVFLGLYLGPLSTLLKHFPGEVIFYTEGFYYGLIQAFRTTTLLTAGLTLALTTHPMDLLHSLRKLKLPYELCFLIAMSFRFLPQIMDEIRENFRAQRARGFVLNKFGFTDKIRACLQIIEMLFVRWIQGVRDMALAIDLRGFRSYPTRTFVHQSQWHSRDFWTLALSTFVFILFIILEGKSI